MPYLNLDDNFADHPKVDGLSDAAFRLHVAGMCYAAKHLTDGRLDRERPTRLVPKFRPSALAELVEKGVWKETAKGYQIHDFLQWNKPRSWWTAKRRKDAERQAQWRLDRGKDSA